MTTPQPLQELPDFNAFLARMINEVAAEYPQLRAVLDLPSEPIHKILRLVAFELTKAHAEFNTRARGLLLTRATGAALDDLAANFDVTRLVRDAGNPDLSPPSPAVMESDDDLRARVRLSWARHSTAGPRAAYEFWALSAHGAVRAVSVQTPRFVPFETGDLPDDVHAWKCVDDCGLPQALPGMVRVTVLSIAEGEPVHPETETLRAVEDRLSGDVIPLTSQVVVTGPELVEKKLKAEVIFRRGVDDTAAKAECTRALDQYLRPALGAQLTRAGVIDALFTPSTQNVILSEEFSDCTLRPHQAALVLRDISYEVAHA